MTLKMKRSCSSALVAILTACLDSIALAWSLLRRTSAAPLATSGDPAPASSSTSDAIPSEQGKNLRDATKASGRRKAPFSSSYPLHHLSFMNFPPSFSFALPWI